MGNQRFAGIDPGDESDGARQSWQLTVMSHFVYDRSMAKQSPSTEKGNLPRWFRGADVPMSVIRQYARAVAERFEPEKIIEIL